MATLEKRLQAIEARLKAKVVVADDVSPETRTQIGAAIRAIINGEPTDGIDPEIVSMVLHVRDAF